MNTLTLNQVVRRIKSIALSHALVRNFYFGGVDDFLNDKTTRFASVFLQDAPGNINAAGNSITYNFKMYCLDLENVSEDTQKNTLDVQSDMMQVATDLIALFDDSVYQDWVTSSSANFVLVREAYDDVVAGCIVDLTVEVAYSKDRCAVPLNDVSAVSWDFYTGDPVGILETLTFRNTKEYVFGTKELYIDFTSAADQHYLVVRLPVAESAYTFWFNTLRFNEGEIPDYVYRAIYVSGDYQYIYTRQIANIDPSTSIIKYYRP